MLKGLAMYQSLKETMNQAFILHWLCIDDETYDALNALNFTDIQLYQLSVLELQDKELIEAKNHPAGTYGNEYNQYCWCLCPWFTSYVLRRMPAYYRGLYYVDSDIVFYESPEIIAGIIGDKSVGIHTHRFSGPMVPQENGWFNVGIVYFKNNGIGKQVADTWKEWLIDTTNPYYKTHGNCGDQKYLELFIPLFGQENVCIFDNQTMLTHLAPWCTDIEPGKKVAFFHFSHFRHDFTNDQWHDSLHGEWNPAKEPEMITYYEDYFLRIKAVKQLIKPKLSIVGNIKIDESKPERIDYLRCVIRSFAFLKGYCEFILNFEGCSTPVIKLIMEELYATGISHQVFFVNGNKYGNMYCHLLRLAKNNFVLNFMEDHFCLPSDPVVIFDLLTEMEDNRVDVLKATFFKVEQNSIANVSGSKVTALGTIFLNDKERFEQYCMHYGLRYYLGVNFITTRDFALKFWDREIESNRPHEWEIAKFDAEFLHTVMVPRFPLLEAIDDDHGEPSTALLNRVPKCYKFENIYQKVKANC